MMASGELPIFWQRVRGWAALAAILLTLLSALGAALYKTGLAPVTQALFDHHVRQFDAHLVEFSRSVGEIVCEKCLRECEEQAQELCELNHIDDCQYDCRKACSVECGKK